MERLNKYGPGLFLTGLILMLMINVSCAQSKGGSVQAFTKINQTMEQRLTFITLGAKDTSALKQFYIEKFGWKPVKTDGIIFFKMNGFILAFYPADELAKDAGVPADGSGFKKFTLSINYRSENEVDEAFKTLKSKAVHVVKAPQKASWGGYSGYVADPEGNLWEIAYNPFLEIDNNGNVGAHQ
jgi:catechol 2,3-dioxygenase-like lactoylglutathione lyase family enzyme